VIYLSDDYTHFKLQDDELSSITERAKCVKASPEGEFLAVGDSEGTLKVFALKSFEQLTKIEAHNSEITSLCFTPLNEGNVRLLATGSRDRFIHIYDLSNDFYHLTSLDEHSAAINAIQFAYIKA